MHNYRRGIVVVLGWEGTDWVQRVLSVPSKDNRISKVMVAEFTVAMGDL